MGEDRKDPLEDVAERQEGHDLVRVEHRVVGGDRPPHPHDVSVGQHRPLRRPGGPGGVDEHRKVFGGHFAHPALHHLRVLGERRFPLFEPLFEGHHHRVLEVPETLQIPHHNLFEMRCLIAEIQPLVQLLLVFDKEAARLGVFDHVFHLRPGIGRIDPHGDPARALDPQIDDHPFGAVVADDGDALPLLKPHRDEGGRHPAGPPIVLVPGDVVPDAVLLLPEGCSRAVAFDRRLEHGRDCLLGQCVISSAFCVSSVDTPWPMPRSGCPCKTRARPGPASDPAKTLS